MLPVAVIEQIEQMGISFSWRDGDRKYSSLPSWQVACLPEKKGGLNVLCSRTQDLAAALGKQIWAVSSKANTMDHMGWWGWPEGKEIWNTPPSGCCGMNRLNTVKHKFTESYINGNGKIVLMGAEKVQILETCLITSLSLKGWVYWLPGWWLMADCLLEIGCREWGCMYQILAAVFVVIILIVPHIYL